MVKRLLITAMMLAVLNIGTALASEGYDLKTLKEGIDRIEANKAKISRLEVSLNGLKIDSRANMWNFIGRSSNEKIIQKRSRILREISSIKDEISGIGFELIKSRAAMYEGLAKEFKNPEFRQVLEYLDALAVAEALATGFMTSEDAGQGKLTMDRTEFLGYKLDLQALKLKSIQTLVKQLKSYKKACQEANQADKAAVLDKYLGELGDKLAEGEKSQTEIKKYIK